ncbi:MAG: GSCFA domain-containing protein [Bacteroidaceae bacterium]|nr:GSCFA domain-containing protein [Bacteroidaceae bacterium]
MKLQTQVEIPQPLRRIGLHSRVAFIGSCFAQNIGLRMRQSGIPALVNPFGVLYNPVSILQVMAQNPTLPSLYFEDGSGTWHCWLADSHFNASTLEACQAAILAARGRLFSWQPDTLVCTLGTTRHYRLRSGALVVGNCHKQPGTLFDEVDASLAETATTLDAICQLFPEAQVVFTVSPYRYAKYGFHASQLAKARLLLAVEQVRRQRPEQVTYFPAYELVLDELRDYRFYDADMLHPSPVALDYVWERFVAQWFDDEARRYFIDFEPIRKALQHRPSDPDSAQAQALYEATQQRLRDLMAKYNIEL